MERLFVSPLWPRRKPHPVFHQSPAATAPHFIFPAVLGTLHAPAAAVSCQLLAVGFGVRAAAVRTVVLLCWSLLGPAGLARSACLSPASLPLANAVAKNRKATTGPHPLGCGPLNVKRYRPISRSHHTSGNRTAPRRDEKRGFNHVPPWAWASPRPTWASPATSRRGAPAGRLSTSQLPPPHLAARYVIELTYLYLDS